MVDVLILATNTIIYDPRVEKIVKSLKNRFYSIFALGWNRQGITRKESGNYIIDLKLFNLKAPEGSRSIIVRFPLFWTWVFIQLLLRKPKVVHACDLDTVIPCYVYRKLFRAKLVFDLHDRYAMANIPPTSKLLYSLVNSLEEKFTYKADVLVTVSEKLLTTIPKRPKYFAIVMNCPEDNDHLSSAVDNKDEIFRLVYTGPIYRTRGLERVTDAIAELNNVELVIAGSIIDKELFDRILTRPKVKYMGLLRPAEALTLEARACTMVVLYDLNRPINRYAMPNKLFEAMMLGVPLITNVAPEVVREAKCGIMVDYDNVNQIRQAIISLKDDIELRVRLGENGRRAFLKKYNWNSMQEELYKIYDNLLQSGSSMLDGNKLK